jgi:hypothetical protein
MGYTEFSFILLLQFNRVMKSKCNPHFHYRFGDGLAKEQLQYLIYPRYRMINHKMPLKLPHLKPIKFKKMKVLKFKVLLLMLFTAFASCDYDDKSSTSNLTNIVNKRSWKITLFNDSGKDELSFFNGYTFTFANGIVTAIKATSKVEGSYTTGIDDDTPKLVLDFGAKEPFDELNEDWQILEETNTKIRLEHISGGNGGTDLLTFEKI